ncbi:hypothetical protein D3C78_1490170 [compost metagenome]
MDRAAERLDCRRFAQRQVQRVDVPTAHVEHATDVLIARNHFANAALIEQFQLRMTEALPEALLRFQVAHLFGRQRGEHAAVLQVALNVVLGHALANDPATFECHLPEQLRLLRPDAAFDHINVTAITVNDLPAITPGGAEPDLGRLQHGDAKTVLQQEQR